VHPQARRVDVHEGNARSVRRFRRHVSHAG
jgi:hypothetical protein